MSTAAEPVLIVGAGQAGVQTAASLRQGGYPGRISIVGDEDHDPYERPPLSKAYLKGTVELTDILLRPREFFAEHDIEVLTDPATGIRPEAHEVELASGAVRDYGHLVLAIGARARPLSLPGADADGVFELRTAADATVLRERMRTAHSACVIGGGFIGLEFAAVAAELGITTTVIEQCERTMARAASPTLSTHLESLHGEHGVQLLLGAALDELLVEDGHVRGARATGLHVDSDLVVVGIGVTVETTLAQTAGLVLAEGPGGGIVVDDHLRTSDPSISAVGDCAVFPCVHADDAPIRLESVQNAADHARAVAARLTGFAAPYRAVPWFWSDQFDSRVQIAGITSGHDDLVVKGDPADGRFSVYCFHGDHLVGVESVNRPGDHVAARRILTRTERPTKSEVAAPDFDPKQAARPASRAAA